MKIFVKVKPAAKEDRLEKLDETHYRVSVKAPPVRGQANDSVVVSLALFFKVPKAKIRIISGLTSREKTIKLV
ncbi:MAG: DUF167 domain-containing protein [bacterium]|nr:DUF167 domain-containing protein [bacterium]